MVMWTDAQVEKKQGTETPTDVKNPVVDTTSAPTSAAALEVAPTGAVAPSVTAPVVLPQ